MFSEGKAIKESWFETKIILQSYFSEVLFYRIFKSERRRSSNREARTEKTKFEIRNIFLVYSFKMSSNVYAASWSKIMLIVILFLIFANLFRTFLIRKYRRDPRLVKFSATLPGPKELLNFGNRYAFIFSGVGKSTNTKKNLRRKKCVQKCNISDRRSKGSNLQPLFYEAAAWFSVRLVRGHLTPQMSMRPKPKARKPAKLS